MTNNILQLKNQKPGQKNKSMSISSRGNSFMYAFNGIRLLLQEPNAKLHFVATVVVIIAGYFRNISVLQWIAISFAIGIVWVTEAFNTCIEYLCDYACNNEWHPAIKKVKDIAAGAVFIASIVSVITGIIVFFL